MTLAELVYVELAVPVVDSDAATLGSHIARAKRLIREADERRRRWLEQTRREALQHG